MLARLDAFGAELDAGAIGELGPLEIGVAAHGAGGVELGGTHTVGVAAADGCSFGTGETGFHRQGQMVS